MPNANRYYSTAAIRKLHTLALGGETAGINLTNLDDVVIASPADTQVLKYNSSTAKWENATSSASAGGSNTQVQFNDAGVLGGDAGFVYNKTTDTATVTNLNVTGGVKTSANVEATVFNFFPYEGDWRIYLRSKTQVDEEMQFGTTGIWKVGSFVGIGTITPTAVLHLKAGTASANTAPLKFMAGTNLTTPENGAFEYDGTNLYFTIGGVRKTVSLI